MEYKAVPLADVQIEDERLVKSLFAITGNTDEGGDVIVKGAFSKSIKERLPIGEILVLWQHNTFAPPIGKLETLKEVGRDELPPALRGRFPDATGALYGEWRALDTERGNEVLAGIKAGAITQNSIGYDPVKWDIERPQPDPNDPSIIKMPIRKLREVRLWEGSPVNWGMNRATTNLKHLDVEDGDPRLMQLAGLVEGLAASDLKSDRLRTAIAELHTLLTAAEPPAADDPAKALTVQALMQQVAIAERELALV